MTWDVDVLVLTPDDWRLWRELRLAALADAPDAFLSRLADWQGAGDTEARWRARVGAPGVGCFVAMLDGRPCGMVSGSADRDGEPVTWLESVWVRPEARGRGVLDRLVSTVAAAAREAGHNAVQLEVRASNARAAAAYERLGFRPTGESRMVAGHLEHVYRLAVIRTSIPLGWSTDLAVLRLQGARITDCGDHLVVRYPPAPTYHWGNFLFVLDSEAVGDADRWLARFEAALPGLRHRAIGFVAEPSDAGAWERAGLALEMSDALVRTGPPPTAPLAEGYAVRALTTSEDWAASTRLRIQAEGEDPDFEQDMTDSRRRMVESGHTRWFGAFAGTELVAELGIVDCRESEEGHLGRYQSVLTAPAHRRRGLTSHLLGVAARWAVDRGCEQLVILADDGTDANRLYRAHGFEPAARSAQAYARSYG